VTMEGCARIEGVTLAPLASRGDNTALREEEVDATDGLRSQNLDACGR
jgi:hypothetical protein